MQARSLGDGGEKLSVSPELLASTTTATGFPVRLSLLVTRAKRGAGLPELAVLLLGNDPTVDPPFNFGRYPASGATDMDRRWKFSSLGPVVDRTLAEAGRPDYFGEADEAGLFAFDHGLSLNAYCARPGSEGSEGGGLRKR